MKPRHPLFQKAIALLESLPNLQATIQGEPYLGDDVLADGELIIQTSGKPVHYICEIKTDITNEIVEQVAEYFANFGKRLKPDKRPLLITKSLSKLVFDKLLEYKIECIDIEGNIFLNNSDIYILVRNGLPKSQSRTSLEITTASLQVIYTILKLPSLLTRANSLSEQLLRISALTGVAPITVRHTLEKLQELDYLEYRKGTYKIIDYAKLFERWELGYTEKLRGQFLIGTFKPIGQRTFSEIASQLRDSADLGGYLIGGELAASILTDYLRPVSATLHLHPKNNENQLAVSLKLKPDPEGDIIFLRQFVAEKSFGDEHFNLSPHNLELFDIANPLLIHAELISNGNSRVIEAARIIYDKYIEGCYGNNQ